ncbi:MAG: tellurite resistance TerB family protein [Pseudomonadota bacterium]
MSLFSRLRGQPKPQNTVAKAVLTPAVSTMIADGSVDDSELAQLSNVVSFSPIFFQLDKNGLTGLVKEVISEIQAKGHDATIQAAATGLSPALCETALCFAARIALADGRLDEGEKASLAQTGHHMNISQDAFGKILDVVIMMQRGPNA